MTADQVLVEHRAAAALTRLDIDALDGLAAVLHAVLQAAAGATTDAGLDRAAAALGVLLSLLPHTHPLAVAARVGLEVGDGRRAHRLDLVQASRAVAAGVPPGWADWRVPHDELRRRRAEPGPLAVERRAG